MRKLQISLAVFLLSIVWIFHTYLITQGYTTDVYERFRDIGIGILVLLIGYFNLIYIFKDKKNAVYYFIAAILFFMIFMTHFLRLIFGGLLC